MCYNTIMIYTIVVLIVLVLWLIWVYNHLITMRMRVDEAVSDIDVQSKRRVDLIPNLVETVKGYAEHEKSLLENVTEARASLMQTNGNALEKAKAEDALAGTLKSLFAVAENYPQLKANENFLKLQDELTDTEDKMQAARRFYNGVVRDFNTAIQVFPSSLIASIFSFKSRDFFAVADSKDREPVQVKF